MDLKFDVLVCAAHLVGIAATLRRLYPPPTETPEAFRIALARIAPRADLRRERPCR